MLISRNEPMILRVNEEEESCFGDLNTDILLVDSNLFFINIKHLIAQRYLGVLL